MRTTPRAHRRRCLTGGSTDRPTAARAAGVRPRADLHGMPTAAAACTPLGFCHRRPTGFAGSLRG
jgi:hypothetical protein